MLIIPDLIRHTAFCHYLTVWSNSAPLNSFTSPAPRCPAHETVTLEEGAKTELGWRTSVQFSVVATVCDTHDGLDIR